MIISFSQGMIATGQANAIVAGGTEFLSDVPIRYNRKVSAPLLKIRLEAGKFEFKSFQT